MNYNIADIVQIDFQDFRDEVSKDSEFEITFPLSSIGYTGSPIDIYRDFLEVSYCCEKIAPFINVLGSGVVSRQKYYRDFKIWCKAIETTSLYEQLLYFSRIYNVEFENETESDRISYYDEISIYEKSFKKRIFVFPELINDYWANRINAYWELASEYHESESKFFSNTFRKYPEHRFGFWKSAKSIEFQETIYFSINNWIIPPETNVLKGLQLYSGFEHDLILEPADKIEYKGSIILISNSTAVYFNQKQDLINSIKCTHLVLSKIYKDATSKPPIPDKDKFIQTNLFGEDTIITKSRKRINYNADRIIDETKLQYSISEFGDLIIIKYEGFNFVFFANDLLTFEEIKELNTWLYPTYAKTQNLINISISEKCNWAELDDDSFEELCYDILYCHPHFDSSTIQKMGKSKSRDGGRDIIIKTKKTPTNEQELFIFQCKFLSDKTSLSASKIPNAGNVIMQYGAKGYGVFTTTVIDSTLYDILEGFNKNLNINTSFCWSKYEIERHLNRHQVIKTKYFKNNCT